MATTEDLLKAWRPPMGWNSWDSYGTTVTDPIGRSWPTRASWPTTSRTPAETP